MYCDFYSIMHDEDIASSYVAVLLDQIDRLERAFTTIYVGGGTPTALNKALLQRLLRTIAKHSSSSCEFTVEANPESLSPEKLKVLSNSGVNRLSIGVQSLDERKLKKLGRLHSRKAALDAVISASRNGFKNIGIDLIYGVWGEALEEWEKELKEALRLPVQHVSCYSLTYEKHTPLYSAIENRSIKPLDDIATARMYEASVSLLGLGAFKQYEVSNFSKDGFPCRHNMNYWENNPYIGLGPSAVSYIDGKRAKFASDVSRYTIAVTNGQEPALEFSERLSPLRRAKETAAVKIRTKDGIGFQWFKAKTGFDFEELEKKALPDLFEKDLIKYKKEGNVPAGIALKQKGFLFCDTVSSALL